MEIILSFGNIEDPIILKWGVSSRIPSLGWDDPGPPWYINMMDIYPLLSPGKVSPSPPPPGTTCLVLLHAPQMTCSRDMLGGRPAPPPHTHTRLTRGLHVRACHHHIYMARAGDRHNALGRLRPRGGGGVMSPWQPPVHSLFPSKHLKDFIQTAACTLRTEGDWGHYNMSHLAQ